MKVALITEDRDMAILFLDAEKAPAEASIMDFSLAPGVLFSDIEDDNKVVWMSTDTTIRVVPRHTVNFDDPHTTEWPIASCILCLAEDDYNTLRATW